MANTQINQIDSITSIDTDSKFIVDSYNRSANTYVTKSISYSNLMAGVYQYGNMIYDLVNHIGTTTYTVVAEKIKQGNSSYQECAYDISDEGWYRFTTCFYDFADNNWYNGNLMFTQIGVRKLNATAGQGHILVGAFGSYWTQTMYLPKNINVVLYAWTGSSENSKASGARRIEQLTWS